MSGSWNSHFLQSAAAFVALISFNQIAPALSIATIDHAITALSATITAPAKAIAAAITPSIETRQDASPAPRDAAGEDVHAPGP